MPLYKGRLTLRECLSALRLLPRLLREIWSTSPRLFSIVLSLGAALGILPVILLAITGRLIDEVTICQRLSRPTVHLWVLFGAEAAITCLLAGSARLTSHFDLQLANEFSLKINDRLIARCRALDLEKFEQPTFQDRLLRVKEQIATQVGLLATLVQTAQQLISILAVLLSSSIAAPWLLAVQLVAVLPAVLWEGHFVKARHLLELERTPSRRLLNYLQSLVTNVEAIKEIQLFDAGAYVQDRYKSLATLHNLSDAQLSRKAAFGTLFVTILTNGLYYLAYGALTWKAAVGALTLGHLVLSAGLLQRFSGQLLAVLNSSFHGFDQLLYIGDIADFFISEPSGARAVEHAAVPRKIARGLEFRDVSFRYKGSTTNALSDVSFEIAPGEIIGLVGENGAGKTTIAKLIASLYEPTEGQILVDGADLRRSSPEQARQLVSAVFQDFFKYDLSVALNIGLGESSSLRDPHRIITAAEEAGAWPIIAKLPNGLDQVLGRRFSGGVDLSGGQWQRLALARAHVRDAQIVLLDEPTAALDSRSESALYESVFKMKAGKIIVLISHRLSTMRFADRLIVLKNGRVIEQGTHEQLLKSGGEYAELFTLQMSGREL